MPRTANCKIRCNTIWWSAPSLRKISLSVLALFLSGPLLYFFFFLLLFVCGWISNFGFDFDFDLSFSFSNVV